MTGFLFWKQYELVYQFAIIFIRNKNISLWRSGMNSFDEILYGNKIREYEKQIILNMISEGLSNKQIMKFIPKVDEEKIEEIRRIHKNGK